METRYFLVLTKEDQSSDLCQCIRKSFARYLDSVKAELQIAEGRLDKSEKITILVFPECAVYRGLNLTDIDSFFQTVMVSKKNWINSKYLCMCKPGERTTRCDPCALKIFEKYLECVRLPVSIELFSFFATQDCFRNVNGPELSNILNVHVRTGDMLNSAPESGAAHRENSGEVSALKKWSFLALCGIGAVAAAVLAAKYCPMSPTTSNVNLEMCLGVPGILPLLTLKADLAMSNASPSK